MFKNYITQGFIKEKRGFLRTNKKHNGKNIKNLITHPLPLEQKAGNLDSFAMNVVPFL